MVIQNLYTQSTQTKTAKMTLNIIVTAHIIWRFGFIWCSDQEVVVDEDYPHSLSLRLKLTEAPRGQTPSNSKTSHGSVKNDTDFQHVIKFGCIWVNQERERAICVEEKFAAGRKARGKLLLLVLLFLFLHASLAWH